MHTPSATGPEICERQLLQAATDQGSSESGSSTPGRREGPSESTDRPTNPQTGLPCLFVPWSTIAQELRIPVVHETLHANLLDMILQAMGIFHTEEQRSFRSRNRALFDQLRGQSKPLESLAPNILEAIYDGRPWNDKWETLLWHMAQHYKFWLVVPPAPGWLAQDEDGTWVSFCLECVEEARLENEGLRKRF